MKERTYWRDLTYHLFHRKASAKRFMDEEMGDILRMQDIDCLEYCYSCKRPVALIEVKAGAERPVHSDPLVALAEEAGVPAFGVFYRRSALASPVYEGCTNLDGTPIRDIDGLTVVDLATGRARAMGPGEYFGWLLDLHLSCGCKAAANIRRRRQRAIHG